MSNFTVLLRKIRHRVNPRTHRNEAKFMELRASVKVHGVIQPILVRPIEPDGEYEYEHIAGESRLDAAEAEHGLDYDMPVLVKDVDDETADMLALIENAQRADMAPSDEAVWAARLVGKLKGDREEAARVIGWSRSKLDKRLALMNCSVLVLQALSREQINLGHAELLATLAKEKQDTLLPVITSEGKSVAELKATIEQVACSLAAAIFDKADCAQCPHNSSMQVEMFGEAIASGNCTNAACYKEKTEKQLSTVAYGLKDEYPVVRIVRAGENHTRIQLLADGPTGVGDEQAKACHACQNFGAAVSGLPDSLGRVFRGQCFDTPCHTKKVAARLKADRDVKAEGAKAAKAGASTAAVQAGKATASGKPKTQESEKPVTAVSETDRVKAYRVALWRKALRREVAKDPNVANQYLLAMGMTGLSRNISAESMGKLFEKIADEKASSIDLAANLHGVHALEAGQRHNLTIALAVSAIEGIEVNHLVTLCKYHKLDLTQHWNLQQSKDFLDLLTKSEMKVIADELGLRQKIGAGFAKLFAKSKTDLVTALLAVDGFDYAGKLPKVLHF